MVVVAVQDLDIDAGLRHAPGQHAELAGNRLLEPLHDHLALGEHLDAGRLERAPGRGAVCKEKVCPACGPHDPCATALDAHSGATERFAHVRERTRSILELDGQIPHQAFSTMTGSTRTSLFTDCEMKHSSCAWWCMVSRSAALGWDVP